MYIETVRLLAQTIIREQNVTLLPILADALEESDYGANPNNLPEIKNLREPFDRSRIWASKILEYAEYTLVNHYPRSVVLNLSSLENEQMWSCILSENYHSFGAYHFPPKCAVICVWETLQGRFHKVSWSRVCRRSPRSRGRYSKDEIINLCLAGTDHRLVREYQLNGFNHMDERIRLLAECNLFNVAGFIAGTN